MINAINMWAQAIIVSVVISVIIEMILPEGNNKKYIKIVLGVYVLFSIIHPITKKYAIKNIDSILNISSKDIKKYEKNTVSLDTNKYIENTYKESLEKNIKESLEEKGYKLLDINLLIDTQNNENYGQLEEIVVSIDKLEKENKVNTIEKVDINTNNTNIKKETEQIISENEINELKDFLKEKYFVDINRIHINE